jgi:hypothetical protein
MIPVSFLMRMMGLFLFDTRSGSGVCTITKRREMFENQLVQYTMFYHCSNTKFMMDTRREFDFCKIFQAPQAPELKSA